MQEIITQTLPRMGAQRRSSALKGVFFSRGKTQAGIQTREIYHPFLLRCQILSMNLPNLTTHQLRILRERQIGGLVLVS
jgi:hypothetical protein